MRRCVDGNPTQTSVHGQKTNTGFFGRHLGYDYLVKNASVWAPVGGKVVTSGWSDSLGNWVELAGSDGRTHRFAHLSHRDVSAGQTVAEGQRLGISGNTGQVVGTNGGYHCHHDVRKGGTKWNDSFDNYVDWEKLLAEANKPQSNMPAVGSKIQLLPVDTRTTYRAGTTTEAGKIHVKDGTYVYVVRGYDPKYPNRVLINSESAGGDGVALALYYTNGQLIPGWKKV